MSAPQRASTARQWVWIGSSSCSSRRSWQPSPSCGRAVTPTGRSRTDARSPRPGPRPRAPAGHGEPATLARDGRAGGRTGLHGGPPGGDRRPADRDLVDRPLGPGHRRHRAERPGRRPRATGDPRLRALTRSRTATAVTGRAAAPPRTPTCPGCGPSPARCRVRTRSCSSNRTRSHRSRSASGCATPAAPAPSGGARPVRARPDRVPGRRERAAGARRDHGRVAPASRRGPGAGLRDERVELLPRDQERAYADELADAIGGDPHFVIDVSRNGRGWRGDWCNPDGAGLGQLPHVTRGTTRLDALLWVKTPGLSDGSCNGGPAAGTWWSRTRSRSSRTASGPDGRRGARPAGRSGRRGRSGGAYGRRGRAVGTGGAVGAVGTGGAVATAGAVGRQATDTTVRRRVGRVIAT